MDGEVKSQAETNEDILTFDIPDDTLERAANAEQQASTGYIALTPGITARGHNNV